jgi:CobQ-like glutamine amidotransferase family enzyme
MTKLHIVHIYPNEMNTYGDRGNLLTLTKRAAWHGLEPVVHYYHVGDQLPKDIDIVLGGGGQDSAQSDIQNDIRNVGDQFHTLAQKGVPMLMVCGTYQLFGNRFITHDGQEIKGIGIFDIETVGGTKRLIGNTAITTKDFGMLYGFENHSGRTYLRDKTQALGRVTRGNGNNGEDKTEGTQVHNAIGTYLHGPLLPNNPALADGLIRLALERKGAQFKPGYPDDRLSLLARQNASKRNY